MARRVFCVDVKLLGRNVVRMESALLVAIEKEGKTRGIGETEDAPSAVTISYFMTRSYYDFSRE